MAKGCFVVRAEVPDAADRERFDHWYATDHLPWAIKTFEAQRGWRCWSRTDPAVHYAFYEFADVGEAQALIGSEKIQPLVADFAIASGATGCHDSAKSSKSSRR
jgi:hypothetical protein